LNNRFLFMLIVLVGLAQPCAMIAQVDHPADAATTESATSGALVALRGAGGEVFAQATTDASGALRFEKVPVGKYTLDFHADGFRDSHLGITIADRRPPSLRVALQILVQTKTPLRLRLEKGRIA
jgi:hypothetical protein